MLKMSEDAEKVVRTKIDKLIAKRHQGAHYIGECDIMYEGLRLPGLKVSFMLCDKQLRCTVEDEYLVDAFRTFHVDRKGKLQRVK